MPLVDFKHGRPVLPVNHPLAVQVPDSPRSSQFSPLASEQPHSALVPDTQHLLGDLQDLEATLQDFCTKLQYNLPSDTEVDSEPCCTPFVTPLQRFARSHFSADQTLPSVLPAQSLGQFLLDPDDNEPEYVEPEDMAGLQLAVLGTAGRWDGSQGPGYWRKRPTMKEAIATQIRSRGGNMQAADQLGVLENQVEPTSGAADWFKKLIAFLRPEIAAASKDTFPSASLTPELATVALGHLSNDGDYRSALRKSLAEALPLDAIAMAGDYTPSRASGMLVPAPKAATQLSGSDLELKENLQDMLRALRVEQELLEARYSKQSLQVKGLQDAVAAAQSRLPTEHAEGGSLQTGAETGSSTPPPDTASLQQRLIAAQQNLEEAEEKLQEIGKQRRSVYSTSLQVVQQLRQMEPAARLTAEVVKAFMHPTQGRLCTAHDCIVLKVFAVMDVVYGIATALQQVKFSELKQGKGAGVSADEGVREFAARIRMHMQSSLDMDPKLAHVQFFAGLADQTVALSAKAAMQHDKTCAMTLEAATEQVLLIESRELEDLKLRAANGDTTAAAELKKRAAVGWRKPTKDPKPPSPAPAPAPKTFNPDPDHPEGKCRLPGHDKNGGHMNKHCRKGGTGLTPTKYAAMLAAPFAPSSPVPAAQFVDPAVAALQQAAVVQSQELESLRLQLANALKVNPNGFSGKNLAAKTHPIAAGAKCTICGFPFGHSNGFCYYEFPEKNPLWAPPSNAKPELIAQWALRRQQRNLPPLAPRPVPPRQPQTANLTYPVVPTAPLLPSPAPIPMLPAPTVTPETVANVIQCGNTGGVATLSAIAKLDFPPLHAPTSAAAGPEPFAGAVMPRSFLQFPPTVLPSIPPSVPLTPPPPTAGEAAAIADGHAGEVVEGGQARIAGGIKRYVKGEVGASSSGGVAKRLRFVDERDMQLAVQAPSSAEVEAMLAELEYSQLVPCLDTFVNMSAATGVSMQLPDGRWQLPGMMITDSGATFGVTFDASCNAVGLSYTGCGVTLVLADSSNVRILGITAPVRLVFARGTHNERVIMYRFLVLPGEGKHYKWLVAKNALLELGAFVDPAEAAFYYRTGVSKDSPKHALPVKCSVPIEQADPADCLHVLQPVVATVLPAQEPAAEPAAGHPCV